MAVFEHGQICKTIAMVAQLSAPYLTEGATKIDSGELAGKRVGESYKFSFDEGQVEVSKNGMQDWSGITQGDISTVQYIKIWDASSKIANTALSKKLEAGDWEQFAKQTGVKVINELVKEVAVMDMGKAGSLDLVNGADDVVAKSLCMNEFGGSVRAYGSYNGIGAILATPKINAPMLSEDKYANGQSWTFGNFTTMRCIKLPTLHNLVTTSSDTVTLAKVGDTPSETELGAGLVVGQWYASATSMSLTLDNSLLKIGDNTFVLFPKTTGIGIVIGDKTGLSAGSKACVAVETACDYEPIIVRADGAQGAVDASSLVEASDGNESFEGVGVAHTEIKNAGRGLDHYYDCVGAYGVARADAVKVLLYKV